MGRVVDRCPLSAMNVIAAGIAGMETSRSRGGTTNRCAQSAQTATWIHRKDGRFLRLSAYDVRTPRIRCESKSSIGAITQMPLVR